MPPRDPGVTLLLPHTLARRPIIIMGVSGSGKTTVGRTIARLLKWPFIDGDDFHSAHSVEKMRAGTPLDDSDRGPWLHRIVSAINAKAEQSQGAIIACSALKRCYRDAIRGHIPNVAFVYLALDRAEASRRTSQRTGHFASSDLVSSQFDILEEPDASEPRTLALDASRDVEAIVAEGLCRLTTIDRVSVDPPK